MIEITLPWPDKRLSPNARVHWAKKHQASARAHEDAKLLTYAAVQEQYDWSISRKLEAQYIFMSPDKQKRDIDNCLAMMKSYQDGVCAAIGIDDSRIKRTVLEWGEVTPGGKVVLRLEEMNS